MLLKGNQTFADTFEKLAHSSLIIETYKKSGMGLDKGLSPTFDLLVDRYFEISDSQNPNGAMTRVREGKTARLLLSVLKFFVFKTNIFIICFQI